MVEPTTSPADSKPSATTAVEPAIQPISSLLNASAPPTPMLSNAIRRAARAL